MGAPPGRMGVGEEGLGRTSPLPSLKKGMGIFAQGENHKRMAAVASEAGETSYLRTSTPFFSRRIA